MRLGLLSHMVKFLRYLFESPNYLFYDTSVKSILPCNALFCQIVDYGNTNILRVCGGPMFSAKTSPTLISGVRGRYRAR